MLVFSPHPRPQQLNTQQINHAPGYVFILKLLSLRKKNFIYLFKSILFIYFEAGEEGEREGEKHQCVVASCRPPSGDLARNPGMCPDRDLNQRSFGLQTGAQIHCATSARALRKKNVNEAKKIMFINHSKEGNT